MTDDKARLVGRGPERYTRPRDGEADALAVPVDGSVRLLLLPDGPNYPETVGGWTS